MEFDNNTYPYTKSLNAYLNDPAPVYSLKNGTDSAAEDMVYGWKGGAKFDPSHPYAPCGLVGDAVEHMGGTVVEGKLLFLLATDAENDDTIQAMNDYKAGIHKFLMGKAREELFRTESRDQE